MKNFTEPFSVVGHICTMFDVCPIRMACSKLNVLVVEFGICVTLFVFPFLIGWGSHSCQLVAYIEVLATRIWLPSICFDEYVCSLYVCTILITLC